VNREGQGGQPFAFRETKDGRVRISYRGRVVATLTGCEARRFVLRSLRASDRELQLLMAKATGNFKRGNERVR